MRTLILSANTGQGHNSCAKAICEAYKEHGDICVIEDVFGLVSKKLSRTIARGHENTYRQTPGLSNASYQFWEKHPGMFAQNRFVYQVMSIGSKQVGRCIREGNYDTVICTHVLAAMTLTATIRKKNLRVRSAFVATDYSCPPGVNGTRLDRYFIPHESIADDFAAAGIPREAIVPVGIPVRRAFAPAGNKGEVKQQFDISPENRHLLMMCGSMGCGPIPEMLRLVAKNMPEKWEITVVCGTNEQLEKELKEEHASNPAVHVRGYVQQMPQLLSSADLYLTKPGGLSTTEAAATAVPMVLVDAVAGCEEQNLHHFTKLGAAVTGDGTEEVVQACIGLMNNHAQIACMEEKLRLYQSHNAAQDLWKTMSHL